MTANRYGGEAMKQGVWFALGVIVGALVALALVDLGVLR